MNLTVIGAGSVGSAISAGAARSGNRVVVTSRDPSSARSVAESVGGTAVEDVVEAVRDADAVVLAVPYPAVAEIAGRLRDAVAGTVVVDATNPLRPDAGGLLFSDRSGAEDIQQQLAGARVVKAFNTVLASRQDSPQIDGIPLDGFYAGDDLSAKSVVRDLLAGIGYHPVDVGPLSRSAALEQMAFLNISLNAANGWPWASGWKLLGPTG